MYVILVYDVGEKRVGRALKVCRRYLNWVQNSVFEGDLSPARLKSLKMELRKIMDEEGDSVLIYRFREESYMQKEVLGKELSSLDTFL